MEIVEINLISGEQYQPKYQAINPLGKVPVLELGDGTFITESLSIIEYFEDIYPENTLTGKTPEDRAKIKALERFIDFEIMATMGIIAHQMMPLFADRFEPSIETINYGRKRQIEAIEHLDKMIGESLFVYGNQLTIADITLFVTFETAYLLKAALNPKYTNINRCLENFSKRSSVS